MSPVTAFFASLFFIISIRFVIYVHTSIFLHVAFSKLTSIRSLRFCKYVDVPGLVCFISGWMALSDVFRELAAVILGVSFFFYCALLVRNIAASATNRPTEE